MDRSRQSMAPQQRNLSLTEELEKLEQSITLTLQEIDHNFSRAHRIVTSSILPIVEQYGKHSEAVWEGSKFWKQFFEASANVSLSGYEAPDGDESTAQEDTQHSQMYEDETVEGETVTGETATPPRPTSSQAGMEEDTSTIDSPSMAHAHSTPRAPNTGGKEPVFADFSSPYESLRREITGSRTPKLDPTTPGKAQALPDMTSLLESSPFVPPTSGKRALHEQAPILHRVLDKTYRVQATPIISPRKYKPTSAFTPGTARRGAPTPRGATTALPRWAVDSSPPSSPAPQLRADIFSPAKTPRTPGVSVMTPGKGKQPFGKQSFSITKSGANIFDTDSEEEGDDLGFSPPKTIQFHIPQSKLLQTPAREASKRIVEDLLMTAGGDITDTTGGMDEDSPSVVRRQVDLDDSF
ncbi:hypothetical protein K458DRAFT_339339 [Lentithecium fluviatile CBS 122367]|uniref:DASH complex subunit ASK1 n=1 Tax=Lentithecium fluviatile CBS 122367 TaxID=1168545 RepID=A0A6G1J1N8_9PLEO|nr:hypothetical protein K458DRAFT_339339 [Lentithecium fluviatile CBS 122367]